MTTHTPGPWIANGSHVYYQANPGGVKTAIAEAFRDVGGPLPCKANARLIAAAPDLLAALLEASRALTELDPLANRHNAVLIDSAIAKATAQ